MSQNDLIHLDSAFKNWQKDRGSGLENGTDPWVYYCLEQFLKPFDFSDEEIASGIIDGQLDGGMDALYFLVDRELVRDDTEMDAKTVQAVDIVLFQIKNRDEGFKPTETDKAFFFADDLLDLSRNMDGMASKYRPEVLGLMQLFRDKYNGIASGFPKVKAVIYYITRSDAQQPNPSALASAQRVKTKVREHFPRAECEYVFVNAQVLLEQIQMRPPNTRTLTWAESPVQTNEGQVGFVSLRNYYDFITDPTTGELARRIFESNVRGWQGSTTVNAQIRRSLIADAGINFWLLNNGITILSSQGGPAGPGKKMTLKDARVVNGLQTSRAIYDYFTKEQPKDEGRNILVRVIETSDPAVFDAVVRATNSQNPMPPASLRATDMIHRQIEELFKQYNLFYDRRKGVYKDEGRP